MYNDGPGTPVVLTLEHGRMSSQLVTATLNADEDDINRQISQQSFLLDQSQTESTKKSVISKFFHSKSNSDGNQLHLGKSQSEHASSLKRWRRCRHHHHQHYRHQSSARLRLRPVTAINCFLAAIRARTRMRLFTWAQNPEWQMTVRIIFCSAVPIRQWTRRSHRQLKVELIMRLFSVMTPTEFFYLYTHCLISSH